MNDYEVFLFHQKCTNTTSLAVKKKKKTAIKLTDKQE